MTILLRDCLDVLDAAYDPSWAEDWDAVGLVWGDPQARIGHVHFAVDPTPSVAVEAVGAGADLLVTHHPLFLRGVHAVPATGNGGAVLRTLDGAGAALHVVHTNADVARPGVSDALAETLGVRDTEPVRQSTEERDLLVVYAPPDAAQAVIDALAAAGAGRVGPYDRCAFTSPGRGTFRPLLGAHPLIGAVGEVTEVAELRVEMVLPRRCRGSVVRALRQVHPYEEPAYSIIPTATPTSRGLGRVGDLEHPVTLAELVARTAAALPPTAAGVRATGDPGAQVQRVAVCGGAGVELAAAALMAGAEVLVTADGRHHTALEAPLPILDVAHFASEWPWLTQAAALLRQELPGLGTSVSSLVTDPWTVHAAAHRPADPTL